jgi:hypothetical protein
VAVNFFHPIFKTLFVFHGQTITYSGNIARIIFNYFNVYKTLTLKDLTALPRELPDTEALMTICIYFKKSLDLLYRYDKV